MDNKQRIIDFCKELKLTKVGFVSCRPFEELRPLLEERKAQGTENPFEEKDIDKRLNPFIYMQEGKTIISIAFPYLHKAELREDYGFSVYTRGYDYHRVVKGYLEKICAFIESLGGKAVSFTDNNALPERYIAYLSGIGFIGKNNMLITHEYGSYVFLGEIITDLELPEDCPDRSFEKMERYVECGEECTLCFDECPTKAINSEKKNANICLSFLTQKKDLEDKWLPHLSGRLFGCDSCQKKCRYNQLVRFSPLEEFKPHKHMEDHDILELKNLDKKTFKEKYLITSCGWRGKAVLQRNALIRSALFDKEDIKTFTSSSEYLMDYKERLLRIKESGILERLEKQKSKRKPVSTCAIQPLEKTTDEEGLVL